MNKILQSALFSRKVRKLTKNQKLQLDDVIRDILKHPDTGEMKKGDLRGIFEHKFKLDNVLPDGLQVYR
ncbi:MAG: type II toxin-antitoxin system RelE/ParE family toxin [Bacteroidales bacterium]